MTFKYIKCKKVTYEALGKLHLAYAPDKFSNSRINLMIKEICDTSLIISIENDEVTKSDYETLNIDKLQEWLDDINTFDETTNIENS